MGRAGAIVDAVASLDGVPAEIVDVPTGGGTVAYDPDCGRPERIYDAVVAAPSPVQPATTGVASATAPVRNRRRTM